MENGRRINRPVAGTHPVRILDGKFIGHSGKGESYGAARDVRLGFRTHPDVRPGFTIATPTTLSFSSRRMILTPLAPRAGDPDRVDRCPDDDSRCGHDKDLIGIRDRRASVSRHPVRPACS